MSLSESLRDRDWVYSAVRHSGPFKTPDDMKGHELQSPSNNAITDLVRNRQTCGLDFTLFCHLMIPPSVLMYMLMEMEVKPEG